ncbi:MAG: WhiB family transcriptional regulator, partial [Actinomycetota bacterium]
MRRIVETDRVTTDYTWQEQASCRGVDAELFFPATEEEAVPGKAICATCPVRIA